jgi:glycosyltransferase involved in cell wall biosynthesis
MSNIFYFIPESKDPSWGIGILLQHVNMLNANGFSALAVCPDPSIRFDWMSQAPGVVSLDHIDPRPDDILVVPEVSAADPRIQGLRCRKVIFVQASILLTRALTSRQDAHLEQYECAFAIMQHIRMIMEQGFNLRTYQIPPFSAPMFFLSPDRVSRRNRWIVTFPKAGYRAIGMPDFELFDLYFSDIPEVDASDPSSIPTDRWVRVPLRNLTHAETARILHQAAFFVNLNSLESLNSTVAESMAAGAIPFCFGSIGGHEYIRDGVNARLFPNHHVFPLMFALEEGMQQFDREPHSFQEMRTHAFNTANRFRIEHTERILIETVHTLQKR